MLCNSPFCGADEGPRGVKRSHVPAVAVSTAAASPVPAPRYSGWLPSPDLSSESFLLFVYQIGTILPYHDVSNFLIEAHEIGTCIFDPFCGRRDLFILPVLGMLNSCVSFLS
jgi:hypothetical protein